MATNRLSFTLTSRLKFFVLLFLSSYFLYAQETVNFIDYSGEHPRFIQRFSWTTDEYALNYEVLIEVYNNGYSEYLREFVENSYIDVSLPPGRYRYAVTPYDLLGLRADTSFWKEFVISHALQPVVERIVPGYFFLDQRLERRFTIFGANILDESQISLKSDSFEFFPIKTTVMDNGRVELFFDDKILMPGIYGVSVVNPGGLSHLYNSFNIGYRKPLYFFIRTAWSPFIPIYGEFSDMSGSDIHLGGAVIGIELISSKRSTFNGGLELSVAGFLMDLGHGDLPDNFTAAGTGLAISEFDLNISLQKRFNHGQMAVTFRFGFGMVFYAVYDLDFTFSENNFIMGLNLGLSWMMRLYEFINLDIGVDFSHYTTVIPSGAFKPRIGLAFQF